MAISTITATIIYSTIEPFVWVKEKESPFGNIFPLMGSNCPVAPSNPTIDNDAYPSAEWASEISQEGH